jgi:hypothetical protein
MEDMENKYKSILAYGNGTSKVNPVVGGASSSSQAKPSKNH